MPSGYCFVSFLALHDLMDIGILIYILILRGKFCLVLFWVFSIVSWVIFFFFSFLKFTEACFMA